MSFKSAVRAIAVVLGVVVFAGATAARSDLRSEVEINEGLIAAGIAYEIGRVCDPIDARMLQGIAFLQSLENRARALGYSREEIDAFIDDRTEQRRVEGLARQRLREMGAIEGNPETYCRVGRSEMSGGTQIGRLLR